MTTYRPSSLKPLTLPHVNVTSPCATRSRLAWQTAVLSFLNITRVSRCIDRGLASSPRTAVSRGPALALAHSLPNRDQVLHHLVQFARERAGAERVVQRRYRLYSCL